MIIYHEDAHNFSSVWPTAKALLQEQLRNGRERWLALKVTRDFIRSQTEKWTRYKVVAIRQ